MKIKHLSNNKSNGFSRYDGNLFTHFTEKDGLSHNSILSIVQDPKGNLWFGTNGNGITRYDGKTFAQFTMKEGAPNIINDIIVDTSGNLWFAANDNGMCKYDGKSFIYFTKKEGLADNIVSTIFQDHLGNLWIGTFGGGVSKYDGKSFTNFTQKEGLYDNRIYSICEDRDGNIWFGTFEHGAAKYDGKTFTYFTTKEGFSHNFVLSVKSDHLGNIWLGTYGGGVAMYDGKSFTFFTEKEGLCSNFTCDIYEDKAGNIWFGTYFGLSRLDYGRFYKNENIVYEDKGKTRNIHFTNYKYEDGFLGIGCTKNAIFEAFDGTVWVGSSGMLSAYHPPIKEEKVDSSAPNIQLTSITLFNEKIDWTNLEHKKDSIFKLVNGVTISNFKFDSLSKWYNLPEHLSLAFDNNFLTFNFIGITLSQPQKVQYQFILEGIDKNWSAMTGRTEAPYGNLPNGTYTFRVKAMNSKGYWSDEFTYTFTIRPPWYFTWWAYLIWMASAIGIAYYFYRFMLNRRLQQSESIRLKELDAIKTRLYTNITHEFRTPLTIILGMADQVITNPKEWFHEGIRLIRRNGKQLLLLVNQLLDLSKLESGTMALHLKQGDIVQYFRYIYESFESFAASKGVAMHLKTELNELQMDYDPEKVQNIVSNLLSNAIKYTPEGGEVTLTLALGKENSLIPTENHKMLKIAVTDSGIGIPEEKIPYIFDRFYQIDDSTTRHAEGTGIGLTLTKELVNLLGGTIEVKSETGQGSTFIIVLPITQNEPFADIEPIEKIEPENTEGPLLTTISTIEDKKKPLVLLVEDNADVVRYIRICLKNEYRIESASNGLMGLEKSMDLIPDIIISDVMMPEMDGFELCQKLKTDIRTSHIPIVLLTAKADADSKIEGLQYGADEYLSKPFEERELKARLKNLLTLRKALQSRYGAPQYWQETRAHEAIEIKLSLDDAFLENLKTIIEENISDVGFDIHHLERELGMSRTKIYRKLTALTDMSATEFIRSVRLTKASEILRGDKAKTISEIAYDVGFTSLSYFTRRFHEMFGVSPTEWREGKKT